MCFRLLKVLDSLSLCSPKRSSTCQAVLFGRFFSFSCCCRLALDQCLERWRASLRLYLILGWKYRKLLWRVRAGSVERGAIIEKNGLIARCNRCINLSNLHPQCQISRFFYFQYRCACIYFLILRAGFNCYRFPQRQPDVLERRLRHTFQH